jgi:glycosyltransferase involved in cell wall biosynthesis
VTKPGVLWVKSAVPWPLDQGNHFVAYNLIRHLHDAFDITLVVPVRDDAERERSEALAPFARVVPVTRTSTRSIAHRALWSLAYRARSAVRYLPPEIFYENFGALRRVLAAEAASGRHDMAFLHYWFLHPLLGALSPLPTAVLLHDCEPQRIESEIETHPERAKALTRNLEAAVDGHHALLARATRVLFYHDDDLDDWATRAGGRPDNASVLPYMFAFEDARERREVPGRILFTGHMSYGPNVDAAVLFARETFPLIRAARPAATFRIAGKQPHPDVAALAQIEGVEVTGYVDDMLAEIAQAAVYVAPLRFGGGLKIKLLEAGGQACPVVATSSALRGFALEPGVDVLRGNDPDEMAEAVLELLSDDSRRRALGERLRVTLLGHYSPDAVGEKVAALFHEIISGQ